MSKVKAVIQSINCIDSLHMLTLTFEGYELKMLSLDLHEKVTTGSEVTLMIKPLAIALGKDVSGSLSFSNQIATEIVSIQKGKILSSLKLRCGKTELESLIATAALDDMAVDVGESVTAYIRASEISIAEVLE